MSQTKRSSSSSSSSLKSKKTPFKRNYLACLNCRTRKVKCDLGSVENPHDPPCARCRRERRECVFVESRRGLNKIKAHKPIEIKKSFINNNNNLSDNSNNSSSITSNSREISINPILPVPSPFFHSNDSFQNNNLSNPSILSNPITDHNNNNNNNVKESLGQESNDNSSNNSPLPTINSSIQNLTNNATMIFLAHVAGKVAHADSRDHINGAERLSQLERSVPIPRSLSSSNNNLSNDSIKTSYFNQSSDSNNSPVNLKESEPIRDSFGHDNSLYPILNMDRLVIPPLTTSSSMRQKPSSSLSNIDYILPSNQLNDINNVNNNNHYILTELEARRLIKIFFVTMHPFYPYIPKELRDPDILANYPMLLCAILSIGARYNALPDKIGDWDNIKNGKIEKKNTTTNETLNNKNINYNNGERHLAVHEQLWIYCQRLMSMTVWGESSSRSVGTLLTFLMFTEWNPRAIHFRWGDYANNSQDDSLANKKFDKNRNVGRDNSNNTKFKNNVTYNNNNDDNDNNNSKFLNDSNNNDDSDEEFAGLSAMKRSEIMSFMLIGTATRLSFLLDTDPLIFIATHVSEIHIAVGLNKKSMLQQTLSEVDVNDPSLKFSSYQKANIELLQFFSLCYETLYGTRPKFISLDKYQTLAILDILSPILENWYRKYYKLLKPSNIHSAPLAACNNDGSPDWIYLISSNSKLERDLTISIERESLILDYYYTKLYLYSLALSGDTSVNVKIRNSKKGRNLRLDELARYSRYVELAYKAAKEVLAVIQRVRKLRLLKYMPVRWVTRVIKSVSFIVKCYLTLTTDIHTNTPIDDHNDLGNNESKQNSYNNELGNSPLSNDKNNNEINNDIYGLNNKDQNTDGAILKLSVIPLEEIITLLQKTAICLRYAAPDELHLCTRYSTILMYLCSQFKTQMRERNEKNNNNVREYEKDKELEVSSSDNDSINENKIDGGDDDDDNDNDNNYNDDNKSNIVNANENDTQNQEKANIYQGYHGNGQQLPSQINSQSSKIPQFEPFTTQSYIQNDQLFNSSTYNPGSRGPSTNPNNNWNNKINPTNNSYQPINYDLGNINFSNANQELFDDFFNKNPSEKLFNFFSTNDNNPGLDFVDQFTKEIEKDFLSKGGKH